MGPSAAADEFILLPQQDAHDPLRPVSKRPAENPVARFFSRAEGFKIRSLHRKRWVMGRR
jgi:hypothetical protein